MTLHEKAMRIKAILLDIDGVQTDGMVGFGGGPDEIKFFNVRDGQGCRLAERAGIQMAVLSGRTSKANETRMRDLGFSLIKQGCHDKRTGFEEVLRELNLSKEEILYIGDDLIDAYPVREAGIGLVVGDAIAELDCVADFRLQKPGGHGAVREAVEWLLKEQGKWDAVLQHYFH